MEYNEFGKLQGNGERQAALAEVLFEIRDLLRGGRPKAAVEEKIRANAAEAEAKAEAKRLEAEATAKAEKEARDRAEKAEKDRIAAKEKVEADRIKAIEDDLLDTSPVESKKPVLKTKKRVKSSKKRR